MDGIIQNASSRQSLLAMMFPAILAGVGLFSLLVGTVTPDARLEVSGVAINPWLFVCIGVFSGALACRKSDLQTVLILLLPTMLLLVSLFWSLDAEYGLIKYVNLLVTSLVAILFFIGAARQVGVDALLRYLVTFLLILLAAAFVYKLQFGFFRREVPFLLNGPIVFARLMGLGALAAFYCLSGRKRFLVCTVFFLAVVWTGSKGPLLALTAVLGLAIWTTARGRGRFFLATAAATFVALTAALLSYAIIDLGSSRLFALLDILTWNQNALGEHTSAGVRVLVYLNTVELIADHPFGVGLGAWADHVSHSYGLDYPHNLFLEVWSESGLILGSLALLPFTIALVLPGPPALRAITLFYFLAQQVSGDLLDARYLLTFSVLHCWARGCLAPSGWPIASPIKVARWRTDRLKPA